MAVLFLAIASVVPYVLSSRHAIDTHPGPLDNRLIMFLEKIMIKKTVLGLTLICASSLMAAEQTHTIRWVLAHQPARVFERAAKHFQAEVDKKSNGRIKVEIVGLDGKFEALTPHDAFKKVQKGDFEMAQTYTTFLGHHERALRVLDLPFLFRDHNHATKVLDGEIGKNILSGLSKTGVKGLAFTYSGGYRIIPTKDKPISKMSDFKGMKIKIPESPVAAAYLKELGAKPIQLQDDKHFERGAEGFETTYARLENIKGAGPQYINETSHSLFLTSILINKKFYDSLPQDLQKIVADSVRETAKLEREDSIRDGLTAKVAYESRGVKVISMDEAELTKMKNAAEKTHEKFKNYFPANLISEIKNQ